MGSADGEPRSCRSAGVPDRSATHGWSMPKGKLAIVTLLWLAVPACLSLLVSSGWPASSHLVIEIKRHAAGATYSRWVCYTQLIEAEFRTPNGCTWEEYAGNNWHQWERGAVHRFDFPDDGTVRFVSVDFVGALPETGLIGTPTGAWQIEWECPKPQWGVQTLSVGDREPAWVRLSEDLSSLVFTCGVSHPAAYPLARLQYSWYRRN
jgi:hypothetical protein